VRHRRPARRRHQAGGTHPASCTACRKVILQYTYLLLPARHSPEPTDFDSWKNILPPRSRQKSWQLQSHILDRMSHSPQITYVRLVSLKFLPGEETKVSLRFSKEDATQCLRNGVGTVPSQKCRSGECRCGSGFVMDCVEDVEIDALICSITSIISLFDMRMSEASSMWERHRDSPDILRQLRFLKSMSILFIQKKKGEVAAVTASLMEKQSYILNFTLSPPSSPPTSPSESSHGKRTMSLSPPSSSDESHHPQDIIFSKNDNADVSSTRYSSFLPFSPNLSAHTPAASAKGFLSLQKPLSHRKHPIGLQAFSGNLSHFPYCANSHRSHPCRKDLDQDHHIGFLNSLLREYQEALRNAIMKSAPSDLSHAASIATPTSASAPLLQTESQNNTSSSVADRTYSELQRFVYWHAIPKLSDRWNHWSSFPVSLLSVMEAVDAARLPQDFNEDAGHGARVFEKLKSFSEENIQDYIKDFTSETIPMTGFGTGHPDRPLHLNLQAENIATFHKFFVALLSKISSSLVNQAS
jgi:hypothetical protein